MTTEKHLERTKIERNRIDHDKDFMNANFCIFGEKYSIFHEFSYPKRLKQNGAVERKNRSLQEMARVMLNSQNDQLNCGLRLLIQLVTF